MQKKFLAQLVSVDDKEYETSFSHQASTVTAVPLDQGACQLLDKACSMANVDPHSVYIGIPGPTAPQHAQLASELLSHLDVASAKERCAWTKLNRCLHGIAFVVLSSTTVLRLGSSHSMPCAGHAVC
jgi:hypothetical protein